MIRPNFFELEFTSSLLHKGKKLYFFYEDNGSHINSKISCPFSDNILDESTDFEYLINFLNYDMTRLRTSLYELIKLINGSFPIPLTESNKKKFNINKK